MGAIIKTIHKGSALEPIIFNNNDIFYFIEKWDFINCAADVTCSKVSSSIDALMEALKDDRKITIDSFHQTFMATNRSKFHFC